MSDREQSAWGVAVLLGWLISSPVFAAASDIRTRIIDGVDGVPINVVEAGDPAHPAIVFIHGLGQSHLSWKMQLESSLADDFHLVAYDLRGHGNSGKPWAAKDYAAPATWAGDLERVITASGAGQPLLVSWSYGTWVAVDYIATRTKEAIAAQVMIGALGGLVSTTQTGRPGDAEIGRRIRAGTSSGLLSDNFRAGIEIVRFFVHRDIDDPQWVRDTAAANALLSPFARPLILQRSFDQSAQLPKIIMPTLLLLGSEDPQVTPEDARALAEQLPGATVSVYEGDGHLPFAESHERFNTELRAFAHRIFNGE